ncbi:hypothetical protein ACFO4N_10470, partial [Camelliibacillus cellulosilyticus]
HGLFWHDHDANMVFCARPRALLKRYRRQNGLLRSTTGSFDPIKTPKWSFELDYGLFQHDLDVKKG